ncbi:MAG: hypothetical protein ACRC8Z_08440 [Empedobacter falsenii]
MKKLFTLFVLFLGLGIANAQIISEKIYAYCTAYNMDIKEVYISNLVNAINGNPNYSYPDSWQLTSQWKEKLKPLIGEVDKTNWVPAQKGFTGILLTDSLQVYKNREEDIIRYKEMGYKIRYVKDFRYKQQVYN